MRRVFEQVADAADGGGDQGDTTGQHFVGFLGEGVATESGVADAEDGDIQGVKEDGHAVMRQFAQMEKARMGGDRGVGAGVPGQNEMELGVAFGESVKSAVERVDAPTIVEGASGANQAGIRR